MSVEFHPPLNSVGIFPIVNFNEGIHSTLLGNKMLIFFSTTKTSTYKLGGGNNRELTNKIAKRHSRVIVSTVCLSTGDDYPRV